MLIGFRKRINMDDKKSTDRGNHNLIKNKLCLRDCPLYGLIL